MLKRKMVGFALFSAAIMFLFMYLKLNARRQFDHPTVNSIMSGEKAVISSQHGSELDFKNFKSAARLASCPIDLLSESQRIPVSPPAVPEDIAGALHRLHGEPSAWFSGQLAHNFIRPKKSMLKHLENARKLYNFSLPTRTPIAGVHVRRTDKAHMKLSAADLVHSERCPKVLRQVYLATDDPSVLSEAKRIFPHYTFYCSQERSKSGAVHQRNHKFAKMSAFIDFVLLSESDFLVCTFSSNVCRFAYELMQARHKIHGDASSLVHSLDTGYFLEPGQPNFCRMVLGDYFTGLLPGQIVDVWSTRLNSRREARRLRNKTYFSQPTYKCQPVVTAAKMSGYDEIKKKHLKLYL
ncbi:unnamed protein product [Calicophoron daubneyi]|uniref:GT23 domain-containing protein n=1 Tax=Calicophoron daubneyi TaxID=300641 RepID=A0AAV2TJB2_CALDB